MSTNGCAEDNGFCLSFVSCKVISLMLIQTNCNNGLIEMRNGAARPGDNVTNAEDTDKMEGGIWWD